MDQKNGRLEELEKLIEESNRRIEEKNQSISKLNEDLSQIRNEIVLAEEKLLKFKRVKILTRKQINKIKKEKLEKAKRNFENQKAHIGSETKRAFEVARKIREEASVKSLEEYESAKVKAKKIEIEALKKEAFVLNCIIEEKEEEYENMLAIRACEEVNCKFRDKKHDENLKVKKFNLGNLDEICTKLKKELCDLNMKINRSVSKLNSY